MGVFLLIISLIFNGIAFAQSGSSQFDRRSPQEKEVTNDLLDGKFSEAEQLMASWESTNPEQKEAILNFRTVESKMKGVPSRKERQKILLDDAMAQLKNFTDQMQEAVKDIKNQVNTIPDEPAALKPLSAVDQELSTAISTNDIQKVKESIKKGANVNYVWMNGAITPITAAVQHGNEDIVRTLIEFGANVNTKVLDLSSLYLAIKNHAVKMVDLLIKNGADINESTLGIGSLLIFAIDQGNFTIVKRLVDAGIDVNKWDRARNTALMRATELGNAEEVELLLKNKAKPAMKNNQNQTALDIAKQQGNQLVIELLSN